MKTDYLALARDKVLRSIPTPISSSLIIEISANLKLLYLEPGSPVSIPALKILEFASDIKKDEFIEQSLKHFLKEHNIKHNDLILCLAPNLFFIKRLQLPSVPENELLQAIKWQLNEESPLDLSSAIIRYRIIKKFIKDDGEKTIDLIAVAVNQEQVSQQVVSLKKAGFNCICVSLSPFGYEKIMARCLDVPAKEAVGLLHLEDELCYIAFYCDNKLDFYRQLPVSLGSFKGSLKGVLVSDKGKVELSPEEIEEILFKFGLPQEDFNYKDKINSSHIMGMLRPVLERLAQEIKRSLNYYDSQFKGGKVKKIFVACQGVEVKNLEGFLTKELSCDCLSISVNKCFVFPDKIKPLDVFKSLGCAGLALDNQRQIDFLPQEFKAEKMEAVQLFSLRWVTFIAALLLAASYVFATTGISAYKKRLSNTTVYLNTISEFKNIKSKSDILNAFVKRIRSQDIEGGLLLKSISNIVPQGLYFKSFAVNCDLGVGSINGYVKNSEVNPDTLITGFVQDLNKCGLVHNAAIYSVSRGTANGLEVSIFQVNFELLR